MTSDPVEEFMRPNLITHETKAAALSDEEIVDKLQGRNRMGNGAILRNGPDGKAKHVCEPPDLYRLDPIGSLEPGAVWRCDCGKRWVYVKNAANIPNWQPRYWPWPR